MKIAPRGPRRARHAQAAPRAGCPLTATTGTPASGFRHVADEVGWWKFTNWHVVDPVRAWKPDGLRLRTLSEGLTTVGELSINKSSRNTIPGLVNFTVDLRHHRDEAIAAMEQQVRARLQAIADGRGLNLTITPHWISPATPFDAECVAAVREAVDALGYAQQSIVSGAGHDAIHLARYCPTAMVFIPCVGGLSHNEAEDVLPEDVKQGTDVLLNAVLARAGRIEQGA